MMVSQKNNPKMSLEIDERRRYIIKLKAGYQFSFSLTVDEWLTLKLGFHWLVSVLYYNAASTPYDLDF